MNWLVALLAFLVLTLTAVLPASASAQDPDPDEFTPVGYTFCGWKVLGGGGWAMEWDDSLSGAYLVAFAKGMTCRSARRNVTRTRNRQTPPYAPYRLGYRCVTLDSDYEYVDVRCVKKGGKRKYRYQGGA